MSRLILIFCGYFSLALGFAGIFLPVLPTTPFILLAGYCFSKSSPRLHSYLREHKTFGLMLIEWESEGVIRMRAKLLATSMIIPMCGYAIIYKIKSDSLRAVMLITILAVLIFIWSCPSEKRLIENSEKLKI